LKAFLPINKSNRLLPTLYASLITVRLFPQRSVTHFKFCQRRCQSLMLHSVRDRRRGNSQLLSWSRNLLGLSPWFQIFETDLYPVHTLTPHFSTIRCAVSVSSDLFLYSHLLHPFELSDRKVKLTLEQAMKA
jgi:hypothetical protein